MLAADLNQERERRMRAEVMMVGVCTAGENRDDGVCSGNEGRESRRCVRRGRGLKVCETREQLRERERERRGKGVNKRELEEGEGAKE